MLGSDTGRARLDTEGQEAGRQAEREGHETERIKAETERSVAEMGRLHAEAVKVEKEAERAVVETERLKAEAMMVRSEKMKIDSQTERLKAETERMKMEQVQRRREVEVGAEAEAAGTDEGLVAKRELLETGAVVVSSEITKTDAEMERVKADTQRASAEETVREELESSGQVPEGDGLKPGNYLEELEAEIDWKELEEQREHNYYKWVHLVQEIIQLKFRASQEGSRVHQLKAAKSVA
ncbi:uncharacterized protein LAJ45_10284 [Morchella importuna]|uniref:uncharacterized protein n=1 Tax=Morchella importuna TaxID=1174673 RepID=UPI001E8DCEA5|nr:uncharacterized protein LAJ45_10284 [Morchella importuna]KAH8145644.1 hypothetical protein LAJ45_10284 [Morchella importuna]